MAGNFGFRSSDGSIFWAKIGIDMGQLSKFQRQVLTQTKSENPWGYNGWGPGGGAPGSSDVSPIFGTNFALKKHSNKYIGHIKTTTNLKHAFQNYICNLPCMNWGK